MALSDIHVFHCFLTLVPTQLSFQSHQLLSSHASEVRGESMPKKKFCLNQVLNSLPLGHESDTLTTEPPRWAKELCSIVVKLIHSLAKG